MTNARTLLLSLMSALFFLLTPAALPAPAVSESASGFPGVPEKTAVPGATSSTGSTGPAASANPAAAESMSLSNRDLDKASPSQGTSAARAPADRVALTLLVDGEPVPSGDSCVIVDPAQDVTFEPRPSDDAGTLKIQGPASMDLSKPRRYEMMQTLTTTWQMDRGALLRESDGKTVWQAPPAADACRFSVALERESRFEDRSDTALQSPLQAKGVGGQWNTTFIVRVPYDPSGNGIVDGYTVGIYPNPNLDSAPASVRSHASAYAPPKFLIPVTPETAKLHVSPHFRLGDFSLASDHGKRHFIALDPRLIGFLESLSAKVDSGRAKGANGTSIRILRAYVSPYQRQLLTRKGVSLVDFTRYQYGDSAAFIVDADGNGVMDDLNGDGTVDIQDAARLAEIAGAVQKELKNYGGIGVYARFEGSKGPATPCVQVDMRGWRQEWRQTEE